MPERIGRYRILERVGKGAMGVVYSAQDDAMGRAVAVKVLMGDLESDPETRARFYREAQAAAGLLHPNIITIYDAGEDQGRSYIAMQLLEGWPLTSYLQQPEATSLERKLDLMVQMCEGLTAAHGREIVHRDLKPGNLFVQSDGLLKILDFGVARLANSSMTATGAMLGTPDYMSPEQARGEQVDRRSDIFSTGAVFYFMLAGRKPFPGPDLPAVLRQLQFEAPAPLRESDTPPELARIVMQAMAKAPAERPQRIQDLLASIIRFRRHYQAETRRMSADAGASYTAIVHGDAEIRQAADALEIEGTIAPSGVLESVRSRYPMLIERGGVALEGIALDRARIQQLQADLEPERHRVDLLRAEFRQLVDALEDGKRALADGDPLTAARWFDQVLTARPDSRKARELSEQCAPLAREQEARETRATDLVAAGRTAFDLREWPEALRQAEAALAIVPGFAPAATLVAEAQQASAREQRRKALLLQQAVERAQLAIDERRYDAAEAALQEASSLDEQSADVQAVRAQLDAGRREQAESQRRTQVAQDAIRQARGAFRRGHYEQALADLRVLAASGTPSAEVDAEIERLSALSARIVADREERRARARTLLASAEGHASRGAMDDALATAREALRTDATGDALAVALAALYERDLRARLERAQQEVREARARDAEPLVAAARQAQSRGFLGAALEAAVCAQRLAPERADVASLVAEVQQAIAAPDTENVEIGEQPFAAPAPVTVSTPRPRPQPVAAAAAPAGASQPAAPAGRNSGVLASLNQWAGDLLRRSRPQR